MTINMTSEDLDAVKMAVYDWEDKNLVNYSGYALQGDTSQSIGDNMEVRGYDAMRISTRVAIKHGLKYLNVYGACFAVDKKRGLDAQGLKFVIVSWYHTGYIKFDDVTPRGVTVFDMMVDTFNQDQLKMVLGV